MTYWSKYYGLLVGLLLGCSGAAFGQTEADSVSRPKTDYRPSSLRIGVSANDLVRTITNNRDARYHGQVDIAFGRFMLVGEYGVAETTLEFNPDRTALPFTYEGEGSFFRVGVDVNLLKNRETGRYDVEDGILLFGLRYARASIDDRLQFEEADPFWGTTIITQQNEGLSAGWVEMTAGVKVEIIKNIFLGYNLRFKFARGFSDDPELFPYYIPGFGRSDREEQFGFDYYVFYRFPLRRPKQPLLNY